MCVHRSTASPTFPTPAIAPQRLFVGHYRILLSLDSILKFEFSHMYLRPKSLTAEFDRRRLRLHRGGLSGTIIPILGTEQVS